MAKKVQPVGEGDNYHQNGPVSWIRDYYGGGSFEPYFPSPTTPPVPYFDLNIYRESEVKALIREQSRDMYELLEKVHFDGNYYLVKCVLSREWECCWYLAVRVQFFGKMHGVTLYPKRLISKEEKRVAYKSLVLVNPFELWDGSLVKKFWNLQERTEFLIARILFHECLHVMIALGKTLPEGFGNTDIFLEFRKWLDVANSKKLFSERNEVQFRLWNLAVFGSSGNESEGKMLHRVHEIYEFLINEKYSNRKTVQAFGSPSRNEKVARKYAWVAAVKAGGHKQVSKRVWQVEVRRLSIALKKLYDRIDKEMRDS